MKVQLYMLQTIDGKTTGITDLDIICSNRKDLVEGWNDYEAGYGDTFDCAIISARTVLKMFEVKGQWPVSKVDCDFVVIDRSNRMSQKMLADIRTRCRSCTHVVQGDWTGAQEGFTEYPSHNLVLKEITLFELMRALTEYGINPDGICLQGGGTLNNIWLCSGLVDEIIIVVAPIILGGKECHTLCDGEDLNELGCVPVYDLASCRNLHQGFLRLKYVRGNNCSNKKSSSLSLLVRRTGRV